VIVSAGAVAGLLLMATLTVAVGAYARRYARTTSDFMVAARAVPPRLNAAAISGEYLSAASFLGVAGLVMQFGYDVLWYPVGYAAGYLVLLVFIAGPLRRFGAYTIPDFAEGRFGSPRFRRLAVGLVILIGLFYTLPQMKAAGITVATAAGVPYATGVVIVAAVVVSIVVAGGMRGITLVQAMQFAVKLFAISVPVFVLLIHYGTPARLVGAAGAAPVPRLGAATTFSVGSGDLWSLSRPLTVSVEGRATATLLPPGERGGTARTTYVGVPLSAASQQNGPARPVILAGRSTLPPGRVRWEHDARVTVAAGAPVPFGSDTPPSSGRAWLHPFGPLAGGSGHPLLFTYSLIIGIVFGTMGLPHILVRFYTNPDARAARRTAWYVLILVSMFYIWPPLYGVIGRLHAAQLYTTNLTDAVVLILPRQLGPAWLGEILAAVVAAGAFAAFASTLSGLLVSLAGALGHDVYGRWLRPEASAEGRSRAFQLSAMVAGTVAAGLGLSVEHFDISILVGWAFAIAASSFFPLLVLGIWWRRLTLLGASVGAAVGGLAATAAIVTTMLAFASGPLAHLLDTNSALAVVLAQPAIVTIPLAFAVMVVLSLIDGRVPADVGSTMLQLHAPDRLGLRRDYVPD
jgi:Na+(H+)/acetate symporter ActP